MHCPALIGSCTYNRHANICCIFYDSIYQQILECGGLYLVHILSSWLVASWTAGRWLSVVGGLCWSLFDTGFVDCLYSLQYLQLKQLCIAKWFMVKHNQPYTLQLSNFSVWLTFMPKFIPGDFLLVFTGCVKLDHQRLSAHCVSFQHHSLIAINFWGCCLYLW